MIKIIILIIIFIICYFIFHEQKYITYPKYEKFTKEKATSIMKKYNVIFVATCRNVEAYLEKNINNIEECAKKFNDYCVIIYENDSKDNTRNILNRVKKLNYYYIFEDNIKEPRRTKRIERGRNLILDKVRELNVNNKYQYLIVLDIDDVNSEGLFVKNIDTCFMVDDWDVLTSNQNGKYYDLWALRIKTYYDFDCLYFMEKKDFSISSILTGLIQLYKSNFYFKPQNFIEVESAFGGTAIYKLSSIPQHCKYVGEYSDGTEKCEHVEFNECIKNNGGKIYINTSFINY